MADNGNIVYPPGVYDPSTSLDDPTALAEMAHLSPEAAKKLPLAVLKSIALDPSYADGSPMPLVRRDFGEPAKDPAGQADIGGFQTMLNYGQAERDAPIQTYNDSTQKFTTYQYPDETHARGGPVRRKKKKKARRLAVEGKAAPHRLDRPRRIPKSAKSR